MTTIHHQLRALGEPSATDATAVGHKAARLATLMQAGFAVPAGVVVPTDVLGREDSRALAEQIVDQLGPGPFAVRSSGVAEDLAGAPYAGLYETVLDVSGTPALAAAIDQCRQSADTDRVLA